MQVDEVARGLSKAQRQMVLSGSWQGQSLWHAEVGELNALEVLHLDVMKASNGNVRHWKGRLTSIGLAIRAYLMEKPDAD
jgi:hypothetical protein